MRIELILEVRNLLKSFGGIMAVHGVSFGLKHGEVSSIIGPNGAGKTTLFNIITGKIKPDEGTIRFRGDDITKLNPHQICHHKIARSFQITNIFPELSVFDNIQVAILSALGKSKNVFSRSQRIGQEETMEILTSLGIDDRKDILAGLLSHGDQKRLDIGIALASRPDILLLDEPTAGMSPEETRSTTDLVQKLALERNLTVLLIEHDMNVVFRISELIRVMHQGQLIAEGKPGEIRNNKGVQRIYLGEHA